MMTVTSRVHKCASCGEFSKALTCAANRVTQSEVLLCPTCFAWRAKEGDQPMRPGSWNSVHSREAMQKEEHSQPTPAS